MLTFTDSMFWFNFLYFFATAFLAFFIPGDLILKRYRLLFFQRLVLGTILGMVVWAILGFLLGILNIRFVSYIYLITVLVIWLSQGYAGNFITQVKNFKFSFDWLLSLVLLGTLVQLSTIFMVGVRFADGIYFCCALPDSLYHIALTNQIIKQIPPIEPGASEILVQNYHYFSNIVAADLIRVFRLPQVATQYQYLVLLISLLIGLAAIVFGQLYNLPKKYIYLLVFFLYFSGDLTYLLFFILGKGLNFDLPYLENAGWLWISPPRVFATVIFFGGLGLLKLWIKNRDLFGGVLMALVLSSLVGFKIYNGIFALAGLGALSLYFLIKRDLRMLPPLILAAVLGFLLNLYINKESGGLIFTGIWRFADFIVSPKLGLSNLELARQIYYTHNNFPRLIQYFLMYLGLYFIFVFGTINLGFLQTKKSLKLLPVELNIFLITGLAVSLIIGSFFIQQTGGANSSQFLITAQIIGSIYASLACFYWLGKIKNNLKYLVIFLIIVLTAPRVFDISLNSVKNLSLHQNYIINNAELQALEYLRLNTDKDALILVDNINNSHWRNAFSYYISFISDRQIFLDGEGIALDHGVAVEKKLQNQTEIFESSDSARVSKLLRQNNIDYIYRSPEDNLNSGLKGLTKVFFHNDLVEILKVNGIY